MIERRRLVRFAVISVVAAIATIGLKAGAYLLTGSIALLSDALESLVNLVAALAALVALWVAARPADKEHTYGHTKAEYFSSGFEGALILVAAVSILVAATRRLLEPHGLADPALGLAITGIAALLNFGVAQVLLRAGDPRCSDLAQAVADLASPTGQWPEAIHPRTLGGCMGDGQHVWAAAEWLLYLRNAFVREEQDRLVLGGGIPPAWLAGETPCSFGPTPTPCGDVSINIRPSGGRVEVAWDGKWRGQSPPIDVRLPGFAASTAVAGQQHLVLERG